MVRYIYTFDAYINVGADSEDDARELLAAFVEWVNGDRFHHVSVASLDAYGILDVESGEELRPVG